MNDRRKQELCVLAYLYKCAEGVSDETAESFDRPREKVLVVTDLFHGCLKQTLTNLMSVTNSLAEFHNRLVDDEFNIDCRYAVIISKTLEQVAHRTQEADVALSMLDHLMQWMMGEFDKPTEEEMEEVVKMMKNIQGVEDAKAEG